MFQVIFFAKKDHFSNQGKLEEKIPLKTQDIYMKRETLVGTMEKIEEM